MKMPKRNDEPLMRPPLTSSQKILLFAMLIRKESAFCMAREQLREEHFGPADEKYAILWRVVQRCYEDGGCLPDESTLSVELAAELSCRIDNEESTVPDELEEFLTIAFHQLDSERFNDRLAAKYLRMFLEDALAEQARTLFTMSTWSPQDLFSLTTSLAEQASAIQGISGSRLDVPFPEGWDCEGPLVEKWRTGCDFFDYFLGGEEGGDSPGEVYGLMGPFGSCKTTTIIQLATNRAVQAYDRWVQGGRTGPKPYVYYMFWEGTVAEVRVRALATLGQIHRATLAEGRWSELSTSVSNLKEYERKMFARQLQEGAPVWPEVVRKRWAERRLNQNFRIVDMTGNDPANPGRGTRLVDDVVDVIRQHQRDCENQGERACCVGVYIDYLIAAIDAYASAHKVRQEEISRKVKRVPLALKNRVAVPFHCPVWIVQQLSGEANALSPGVVPKLTDSAEGKSFAENLDFCFQYGGKTQEMYCVLACGKSRREAPRPPIVVRIDGDLATVRNVSDEYVLDTVSRRIVAKSEMSRIRGSRAPRTVSRVDMDAVRTQLDD